MDLQNDFCPGGNLAVAFGDEIIPLANHLQDQFELVIATQDWHPADHTSFASNHPGHQVGDVIDLNGMSQILWPDHCIQQTPGAAFHSQLNTEKVKKIFYKGIDKSVDSYSAFFDNAHLRETGLNDYLHDHDVTDVYLIGLATDYCVKYSALDAAQLGFNVYVIEDACRGVELMPGDTARAIQEMKNAGIYVVKVDELT